MAEAIYNGGDGGCVVFVFRFGPLASGGFHTAQSPAGWHPLLFSFFSLSANGLFFVVDAVQVFLHLFLMP
jgi:hypothetical protein